MRCFILLVLLVWMTWLCPAQAGPLRLVFPHSTRGLSFLLKQGNLAYAPADNYSGNEIDIWELSTGRWLASLDVPVKETFSLVSSAPWLLALSSDARTLQIWKNNVFQTRTPFLDPHALGWDSESGIQIGQNQAFSLETYTTLIRLDKGRVTASLRGLPACPELILQPKGNDQFTVTSGSEKIWDFDARTLKPVKPLPAFEYWENGCDQALFKTKLIPTEPYFSVGQLLQVFPLQLGSETSIIAGLDQVFTQRSLETGQIVAQWQLPGGEINAWTLDQEILALSRPSILQPNLEIWNWKTRQRLKVLNGHHEPITRLNLNASLLVTVSERSVCSWNIQTGQKLACVALQTGESVLSLHEVDDTIRINIAHKKNQKLTHLVVLGLDGKSREIAGPERLRAALDSYSPLDQNNIPQNPDILLVNREKESQWLDLQSGVNKSYHLLPFWPDWRKFLLQPATAQVLSLTARKLIHFAPLKNQTVRQFDPCKNIKGPCFLKDLIWSGNRVLLPVSDVDLQSLPSNGTPGESHIFGLQLWELSSSRLLTNAPQTKLMAKLFEYGCLQGGFYYFDNYFQGTAVRFDMQTGVFEPAWRKVSAEPFALFCSPDGLLAYTGSGWYLLPDHQNQTAKKLIGLSEIPLGRLGSRVLISSSPQTLQWWNVITNQPEKKFHLPEAFSGAECHQVKHELVCRLDGAKKIKMIALTSQTLRTVVTAEEQWQFDPQRKVIPDAQFLQTGQGLSQRQLALYSEPEGLLWVTDQGHTLQQGKLNSRPYLVENLHSRELPSAYENRTEVIRAIKGLPPLQKTGLKLDFSEMKRQ